MDQLRIWGGIPLRGEVTIGGAKNAALPLMCLPLLTDAPIELRRLPLGLADIRLMQELLIDLGVAITPAGPQALSMHLRSLRTTAACYETVQKMRASVLVLGPLLSRHGYAKISLPGGCAIGERPVDMHISALETLGAEIQISHGYIEASARNGLTGSDIRFATVSVGATETALMAATLANGRTRIFNAACEPEIVTLCECLRSMGANITGEGGSIVEVVGVKELKGTQWLNIQDRLEAGSMMLAFAATRGEGRIHYSPSREHLGAVMDKMRAAGVDLDNDASGITISASGRTFKPTSIETQPFPGFPTDLQAPWMAWMTTVAGKTKIHETIFENRFRHVPELRRLGANINVQDRLAVIDGVKSLSGAAVEATDIRASMGLIIAALCSDGETIINDLSHLDRGYERIEYKLTACGAKIVRNGETGIAERYIA